MSNLPRQPEWMNFRRSMEGTRDTTRLANTLIRCFGSEEAPVDVEGIANRLGVDVRAAEGTPAWSGAIRFDQTQARLWVRKDEPHERQRFVIAHELGHLFLHEAGEMFLDGPVGYEDETFKSSKQSEMQANQFAADLLVPMWLLDQYSGRDMRALVPVFGVSEHVLLKQLEKLRGYAILWR